MVPSENCRGTCIGELRGEDWTGTRLHPVPSPVQLLYGQGFDGGRMEMTGAKAH